MPDDETSIEAALRRIALNMSPDIGSLMVSHQQASPDGPRIGPTPEPFPGALKSFWQQPDDSGLPAERLNTTPTLRAPTTTEHVKDMVSSLLESLGEQPLVRAGMGALEGYGLLTQAGPSPYEQQFGVRYGALPTGKGVKGAIAAEQESAAAGATPVGSSSTLSQAARTKQLTAFRKTLAPAEQKALATEIKTAFPTLDEYTKPTLPVRPKTLVARAATLSPGAQAFVNMLVQSADPKRGISAGELQAMAAGKAYKPPRLIRPPLRSNYNTDATLPGAPLGVTTVKHEQEKLADYLDLAQTGVSGAHWYDEGGQAMMAHAGDDPERARLVAALHSITSPSTDVAVNSQMAIKGYNQGTVGDAIKTGRYPARMSKEAEDAFAGTSQLMQNMKRGPFFDALARAGGFSNTGTPLRPTNDIWQAEAWGYANEDGTPMRKGFGKAQHAWMDRMTQTAVDTANARALGGRTDWTLDRLQAAAWFGAKVREQVASGRPPEPYADFATGLQANYAQGGREALPGPATGHLKGLEKPTNAPWLAQHAQQVADVTTDPQGRDRIAMGFGALTGPSLRGPGAYQGVVSPGVQTQVATGTADAPPVAGVKGRPRMVDPASAKLMDAIEAAYALNYGQGAMAWGRFFPGGPAAARDALEATLGRTPTQPEFEQLMAELQARGVGKTTASIFTPQGFVLKNTGDAPLADVNKSLRASVEATHGKGGAQIAPGAWRGNYLENNWDVPGQQFGQRYYKPIEPMREQFDLTMPQLAQQAQEMDRLLREQSGGKFKLSKNLTTVRKVMANEGYAGLEKLAKKFGVSVVLLAAAAGLAEQSGAETTQQ